MGKTIPRPLPGEPKEVYLSRLREHQNKYYNKIPVPEPPKDRRTEQIC